MKKLLILLLTTCCAVGLFSQEKGNSDCFAAGEKLEYNLYFKFGIFNSKAGEATLTATNTSHNGLDAYKLSMTSNSQGMARKFFAMDDTLSSVVSKDMLPLQYNKDAHEGSEYTKEVITYDYHAESDSVDIRSWRSRKGTLRFDETFQKTGRVYDLIGVVYYARSLDYGLMKEGDHKTVEFISGKNMVYMVMEHQGDKIIKGDDGLKYNCVCLSLFLSNVNKLAFDADEKEEAMRVYITKDANKIPIRMEFKLKVGSTRAILQQTSGLKHSVDYKKKK